MSAQDYYGGGGGGYPNNLNLPTALPKVNTDLLKASTGLPRDSTAPRKDNTMALLKAKLLCSINKLLLNRVVERAAAAVA
ncbi:hypothetical protein FCULG_00004023 [Fusarium culmorum]|uniref:Uncharacterized protein n=1 Tax=Fusarium culmorum TaxID=5516 RepID=A0A2T4HB20_FUSCU|nr:hypothetical protein FCULG_00004023 [Fusarium culmorum]